MWLIALVVASNCEIGDGLDPDSKQLYIQAFLTFFYLHFFQSRQVTVCVVCISSISRTFIELPISLCRIPFVLFSSCNNSSDDLSINLLLATFLGQNMNHFTKSPSEALLGKTFSLLSLKTHFILIKCRLLN